MTPQLHAPAAPSRRTRHFAFTTPAGQTEQDEQQDDQQGEDPARRGARTQIGDFARKARSRLQTETGTVFEEKLVWQVKTSACRSIQVARSRAWPIRSTPTL